MYHDRENVERLKNYSLRTEHSIVHSAVYVMFHKALSVIGPIITRAILNRMIFNAHAQGKGARGYRNCGNFEIPTSLLDVLIACRVFQDAVLLIHPPQSSRQKASLSDTKWW